MTTTLTLGEIDALCRKAARGAGYSWGMAEEAGRSARWLAAYGFQGPEALATWLSSRSDASEEHQPKLLNGVWQATKSVCPLVAGTLLSDRESLLLSGESFEFSRVQQPMLMLPLVARIVETRDCMVVFSVGDLDITCAAQGIVCAEDFPWHKALADVSCYQAKSELASIDETIEPSSQSRSVEGEAVEILLQLAHRTYAPATEASRSGAGAGTSDND